MKQFLLEIKQSAEIWGGTGCEYSTRSSLRPFFSRQTTRNPHYWCYRLHIWLAGNLISRWFLRWIFSVKMRINFYAEFCVLIGIKRVLWINPILLPKRTGAPFVWDPCGHARKASKCIVGGESELTRFIIRRLKHWLEN